MNREEKLAFCEFIKKAPTPFHAVNLLKETLMHHGFSEIHENESWSLKPESNYFIIRNGAMIAFKTPKKELKKAIMLLSHTDSPGFKIKQQPQKSVNNHEIIGLELYGSPLIYTWVDQTLYPAGMVYTKKNHQVQSRLVNLEQFKTLISPLAIHLDRDVNQKGASFNKQTEINPLFSLSKPFLKELQERFENLLSFDLFLVPLNPVETFGLDEEFIAAYRIDNLSSVYASLQALLNSKTHEHALQTCIFFDHEEIGSQTAEGAESKFFEDILKRISLHLTSDHESFYKIKSQSLALSIDVAHAVHPHFPAKHDMESPPYLGKGPVIKFSAAKKYATTAKLAAHIQAIKGDVPTQNFHIHGEIGSGSTVGPIFSAKLGIDTIDLGIGMLGMHAMKEVMAFEDLKHLTNLLESVLKD